MEREEFEKLVKKEENRLKRIVKKEAVEKYDIAIGIIERIAFHRISIENLEEDIKVNGWIEMFTQSENVPPYERERQTVKQYNGMVKTYSALMKQLNDLLPDNVVIKSGDDKFDSFINKR